MNPARGMFEREQDLSHLLKCPTAAHLYAFEVFSQNKSLLCLIFIRRADWRGRGYADVCPGSAGVTQTHNTP